MSFGLSFLNYKMRFDQMIVKSLPALEAYNCRHHQPSSPTEQFCDFRQVS